MSTTAAEAGGVGGLLGGPASSLGGGKLGDLASLAGGFKQLNLDSGMIQKFVPIIMDFVQDNGSDSLKGILAGLLK